MELVLSSLSIVSGLPCVTVRSAPAITVSGPAQRLLSLWPASSRSRLATLSIESSDSFVASTAASIATGWNEPVPGRKLHPLKSSAFHGALFRQLTRLELVVRRTNGSSVSLFGIQTPVEYKTLQDVTVSIELNEFRFEVPLDTVFGLFLQIGTDNFVLVLGIERLNCKRIIRPNKAQAQGCGPSLAASRHPTVGYSSGAEAFNSPDGNMSIMYFVNTFCQPEISMWH